MYDNIPDELKVIPNWILWNNEVKNGNETKVPYNPNNGQYASISNPATWGSFQQCLEILPQSGMSGIGFVITPDLGLTCIDIDDPYKRKPDGNPKFTNPDELFQRQQKIVESFDTYQEISPSGKGVHIWAKGSILTGRDKYSIGIYPHSRFMTMTGNVLKDQQTGSSRYRR
jgi:putative DNA primase/helicase